MNNFFRNLFGRNAGARKDGVSTDFGKSARADSIQPILRKVLSATILITLVLFIALFIFFGTDRSFIIFTVAIVMGAYYISGCVLGFIFAIPKSIQSMRVVAPAVDKDGKPIPGTPADFDGTQYKDNTSLEEISDWLTKIIIGLSLTQFNHLQDMIHTAAKSIQAALASAICEDCTKVNLYSFSYALIILYSLAGACSGYLWTRIEFPKILKKKDSDMAEKLTKTTNQLEELLRKANDPDNKTVEIGTLKTGGVKVEEGKETEIMNNILRLTPEGTSVVDDEEKGRWGGQSSADNLRFTAEVKPSPAVSGFFTVRLIISTIDKSPIASPVGFVLHKSFDPQLRVIKPDGAASVYIEVLAYEAFTAGALCNVESEQKYTKLELDLNQLPGLPPGFAWS